MKAVPESIILLNFVKLIDRLRNLGFSNRCHVYFPRCNESERETKVTKEDGEEARGRKKIAVVLCPEFFPGAVSPWSNIFRFFVRGAQG